MEVMPGCLELETFFRRSTSSAGAEPMSPLSTPHAGMLPVINEECVAQAVRTGLASRHDQPALGFDRKNYFYPICRRLPDFTI